MRNWILILLVISYATAFCQDDALPHCIFFQKQKDYRLRNVTAGDNCIIGLKQNGEQLEGTVSRIAFDTVIINGRTIRLKEISWFAFRDELKSPILLTKPSDLPKRFVLYSKDTVIWQPIIPPQSIFNSSREYHWYVKNKQDSIRFRGNRVPHAPRGPRLPFPHPGPG